MHLQHQTIHATCDDALYELSCCFISSYGSHQMLKNLQTLAQEDPTLHMSYMPETQDIYIQLMGEIQIEILQNIIRERFHEDVHFDHGEILYKETT